MNPQRYVITFHPRDAQQDSSELRDSIHALAEEVPYEHQNVWIVETFLTCGQVRRRLQPWIARGDRLAVTSLG